MAYHEDRIFDFRKKYLPTNQVKYHYPARFDLDTIEKIQTKAEQIFKIFGMNDFARFDGWVLSNGEIWFSDFNTISGMEQNSFLFQQSSRIGMSHSDFLRFILKNSCQRQGIQFSFGQSDKIKNKKPVAILFGGGNSERQVSLMSGTNAWLKLRKSKIYEPKPYLLDFEENIWRLPYSFVLNHTVEEIFDNANKAGDDRKKIENLEKQVRVKLALDSGDTSEDFFMPEKTSFPDFVKKHKFIFLGLHGGDGENGNIQKELSKFKIKYNGSDEKVSRLCMDKFITGEFIRNANIPGISIAPQKIVSIDEINAVKNFSEFWEKLKEDLRAKTIIAKPRSDGCSTGVVHLYGIDDFKKYFIFVATGAKFIPPETLKAQGKIIEMPNEKVSEILFEKFIETDLISIKNQKLRYRRVSGFVEVTIGLLEDKGKMRAFNPSITISEGEVLSLEEKFQGGTGINLTPPPKEIIKPKIVLRAKKLAERIALKIGLKGYARLDAFMNIITGALVIIEVNTLPGLTPSTVLYHQALAENPQIFPLELLEKIIKNAGY
jgi:D-alanine-D-alanine ligase-like ATP-grasp enzyme